MWENLRLSTLARRTSIRKADYLNGKNLQKRNIGGESHTVIMQEQQVIRMSNGLVAFIAKKMEYIIREVLLQLYR